MTITNTRSIEPPSYPATPTNLLETAIENAFHLLQTKPEMILKFIPSGIERFDLFQGELEDVWERFVQENGLSDLLIEDKETFLSDCFSSNCTGGRLFCEYRHQEKKATKTTCTC